MLDPCLDLLPIQTLKVREVLLHVFFKVDEASSGRVIVFDVEEAGDSLRILIARVDVDK